MERIVANHGTDSICLKSGTPDSAFNRMAITVRHGVDCNAYYYAEHCIANIMLIFSELNRLKFTSADIF
jgi:hypothetical protein